MIWGLSEWQWRLRRPQGLRCVLSILNAGGAAASQRGAGAHPLLAILNTELGLSCGRGAQLVRVICSWLARPVIAGDRAQ